MPPVTPTPKLRLPGRQPSHLTFYCSGPRTFLTLARLGTFRQAVRRAKPGISRIAFERVRVDLEITERTPLRLDLERPRDVPAMRRSEMR